MCKRLFIALLAVLLLPPLFGEALTYEQTVILKSLLLRYEGNETELSNELKVLNQNLDRLYQESENSKSLTKELRTSLMTSQLQVEALTLGLESMGKSITTLESTLKKTEFQNKLLKYGLAGVLTVAIVEAVIIAIK